MVGSPVKRGKGVGDRPGFCGISECTRRRRWRRGEGDNERTLGRGWDVRPVGTWDLLDRCHVLTSTVGTNLWKSLKGDVSLLPVEEW